LAPEHMLKMPKSQPITGPDMFLTLLGKRYREILALINTKQKLVRFDPSESVQIPPRHRICGDVDPTFLRRPKPLKKSHYKARRQALAA
jgi:hypothetical protein